MNKVTRMPLSILANNAFSQLFGRKIWNIEKKKKKKKEDSFKFEQGDQ